MSKYYVIYILKWGVAIVIPLVLMSLVITYSAKVYYRRQKNIIKKKQQAFQEIIKDAIITKQPEKVETYTRQFSLHVNLILDSIDHFKSLFSTEEWQPVEDRLVDTVIKPAVKGLASSSSFSNRYLAVRCISLLLPNCDSDLITKLIEDKTLLISLKVSILAVNNPTQKIIDCIIDVFSQGRRLQQTLFSEALAYSNPHIEKFIFNKMQQETDPYKLVFCYRLLMKLNQATHTYTEALNHLGTDNLDLKISALRYSVKTNLISLSQLREFLDDYQWQVRVVAIQLLKEKQDVEAIPLLNDKLKDKEWWVRMNAALALAAMGESGIHVLKSQDPTIDRFAYEVSNYVLLTQRHDK